MAKCIIESRPQARRSRGHGLAGLAYLHHHRRLRATTCKCAGRDSGRLAHPPPEPSPGLLPCHHRTTTPNPKDGTRLARARKPGGWNHPSSLGMCVCSWRCSTAYLFRSKMQSAQHPPGRQPESYRQPGHSRTTPRSLEMGVMRGARASGCLGYRAIGPRRPS